MTIDSPSMLCETQGWSEPDRLAALESYSILDTPLEPLFDDLVELAADVCEAPIAVINLIADSRQWFKAETGIGARELPLDVSICRFAILQPGLFVVPDLSKDPRFENNPLVTQTGGLRFYAGALLETPEGLPLGTVCILDTKPREEGLAERQGRALISLARHVMSELELRRTVVQRERELADKQASVAALDALIATQQAVEAASDDFQKVLEIVARGALVAAPSASGATIELVEGSDLVYQAAAGATEPYLGLRIPCSSSLAGRAVAEAQVLVAADTETDERVNREACRRVGARCLLAVPVFRRGEAVGVLKLQSSEPHVFGEREITLAQLFTGVLATAFADAAEAEAIAALRASEADLRQRLNAIPQMVWSTLPDGFHDFYNDRWYEFTGVPAGRTDGEGWSGMFHPEDRDRAWKIWRRSLATGEPYEIEYRLRHWSGNYLWVLGRALPIRDQHGCIQRWMGTCTNIDDLKRTSGELGRASALLRLIGDSTPDLIYAKDLDSRLLYANPAAQRVIGLPLDEIIGRTDLDWAVDRSQAKQIIANDQQVIASGETLDLDETFTGLDGKTTYFRSVKAPLRGESGEIVGLVGITSDITKRREAEERERLLSREIDHRSKNLLAVVQSVVQLTRAEGADTLKQAITGRIQSLARAHSLLAEGRWESVDLRQLITEELAAYAGRELDRVSVEGPSLQLRPTAAQALGLVMHELATNATKYGSLSVGEGRLAVHWSLEAGERQQLRLSWIEMGGPATTAPTRRGFGTTVVRTSIERQLNGRLEIDWHADGLRCQMVFPASQILPAAATSKPQPSATGCSPDRSGKRATGCKVLVVEDEALIALQMEQALREAGCEPLGPAATILEALEIINREPVEAALLDVNLAGGRSYAVADVLAAKNVPFAFCTGYSSPRDLPARFADAALITKPLRSEQISELIGKLAGERAGVCG